ncbi:hypothetical protein P7K49_014195 [Saguinus oedipus]|uniref:Uncharacterized protein n=1 Tax=Saguinus oedipus TaxID=9490 RepID=A0ABQ9VIP8_SAGOE|nr:hypothetical protein P7K49_014195 [Saguinus oedipus]
MFGKGLDALKVRLASENGDIDRDRWIVRSYKTTHVDYWQQNLGGGPLCLCPPCEFAGGGRLHEHKMGPRCQPSVGFRELLEDVSYLPLVLEPFQVQFHIHKSVLSPEALSHRGVP